MTTTAPQHRPATHLTNDTTTTTHYSSKTDKATETDSTATRSKPSHLCITIRRGGPASGRPDGALRVAGPRQGRIGRSKGWRWC